MGYPCNFYIKALQLNKMQAPFLLYAFFSTLINIFEKNL
jgi:hypothetical protein